MVKGTCNTAASDTTSELYVRKCHTGRTRYRANEWRLFGRNQGGTVEYFVSHP